MLQNEKRDANHGHLLANYSAMGVLFVAACFYHSSVAADDATPKHVMRVLTVGNRLPFRQEVIDGIRYELTPPEGSLPPAVVRADFASNKDDEQAAATTRLRLGEVSMPLRFPVPESGSIQLRDAENQPWLKTVISPSGATLVVVWKTGQKWNEVASLTLDDSNAAIPNEAIRIVNASSLQVGVVIGSIRYRLLPSSSHVFVIDSATPETPVEIAYQNPDTIAESPITILQTTVSIDPRVRRQWVIHRADQPGARRPVGIIPVSEPRRMLPVPRLDQLPKDGQTP